MAVTNFACSCDGGIGNLGVPGCVETFGLSFRDIFMNTTAKDGTRNSIKSSDLVNGKVPASFLLEKLNEPDPSKRWYITPDNYEEVAPARTDRQTVESATGTIKSLRNGVKTFLGELWDVPSQWSAKLNKASCNQISVFKIDEGGAMAGVSSNDGLEFFPLTIQKGSLNAESFDATPAKSAYTSVTYQLSRIVNEGLYLTLSADDFEVDIREAKSLIEFDITQNTVETNTATEIYFNALNTTYGTFGSPHALEGASGLTDWTVLNGLTPVVPSAVEEISAGVYKLTIPSTPTVDLTVSFNKTRMSIDAFGYVADSATITTGA